jgi:hypothetical protein
MRRFLTNRIPAEIKVPEGSRSLRVIAFAAQSVAAASLAYTTQLNWLWLLGTLFLAYGHTVA